MDHYVWFISEICWQPNHVLRFWPLLAKLGCLDAMAAEKCFMSSIEDDLLHITIQCSNWALGADDGLCVWCCICICLCVCLRVCVCVCVCVCLSVYLFVCISSIFSLFVFVFASATDDDVSLSSWESGIVVGHALPDVCRIKTKKWRPPYRARRIRDKQSISSSRGIRNASKVKNWIHIDCQPEAIRITATSRSVTTKLLYCRPFPLLGFDKSEPQSAPLSMFFLPTIQSQSLYVNFGQ